MALLAPGRAGVRAADRRMGRRLPGEGRCSEHVLPRSLAALEGRAARGFGGDADTHNVALDGPAGSSERACAPMLRHGL